MKEADEVVVVVEVVVGGMEVGEWCGWRWGGVGWGGGDGRKQEGTPAMPNQLCHN